MRRNIGVILLGLFILGYLLHLTAGYMLYWFLGTMLVFCSIVVYDILQNKNSITKNYPLLGRFRYVLRKFSPEIRQYFVEGNTDGTPFNKNEIKLVNNRADMTMESHPFGTEMNLYEDGYECVPHSQFPKRFKDYAPKVVVGGKNCL
jgi:hypothetical protein